MLASGAPPARSWPARLAWLRDRVRASPAAALLLSTALVIASTLAAAVVTPRVPADAAGVIYLVAVLGASTFCGLRWGLATSVASALAFNFFFLPPAHTLVIRSSSDWAALAVFVATALVTSNLAARARSERDEAARRAAEARLSESFATLIADAPDLAAVLPALGTQTARALGGSDGAIHRGTAAPGDRKGVLPLELNGRWMGELRLIGAAPGATGTLAAQRIARSLAGLIALGEERERRVRQQVQTEALNRSDELKTALLRAVSHDLRSPLMAITTAAGGLRYANLDDDEGDLLRTIVEQGERMRRMVDNLLDLSKLEAGAAAPHADWLDPRELIEAAVDELAGDDAEARVVMRFPSDPPLVRGDAAQLQRVVVNLLENALKFSPPGSPVEVAVTELTARLEVSVCDRGVGVVEAEAARVFEPFYRSQPGSRTSGSGLGLAIARGLAVANGCKLTLRPGAPSGSTFVLSIPVQRAR